MEMNKYKTFLTCEEVEADFDKMLNDEEEMTDINLKDFTEIFGTGYHWGVPYRLDKEKYRKLFDVEGGKPIDIEGPDMMVNMECVSSIDLKRADSVMLDLDITLGEDECDAALYIFSNIKDEDDENPMYDCINMYGVEDFDDLKEFILKVTGCFAGNDQVDNKFIDSMIAEKEDQINELLEDIETFRKFKK